jgi:hypothetical protein
MLVCMHANMVRLVAERVWRCLDCHEIVPSAPQDVVAPERPGATVREEMAVAWLSRPQR